MHGFDISRANYHYYTVCTYKKHSYCKEYLHRHCFAINDFRPDIYTSMAYMHLIIDVINNKSYEGEKSCGFHGFLIM